MEEDDFFGRAAQRVCARRNIASEMDRLGLDAADRIIVLSELMVELRASGKDAETIDAAIDRYENEHPDTKPLPRHNVAVLGMSADGRHRAEITLSDGRKVLLPRDGFPLGTSTEQALGTAADWQAEATAGTLSLALISEADVFFTSRDLPPDCSRRLFRERCASGDVAGAFKRGRVWWCKREAWDSATVVFPAQPGPPPAPAMPPPGADLEAFTETSRSSRSCRPRQPQSLDLRMDMSPTDARRLSQPAASTEEIKRTMLARLREWGSPMKFDALTASMTGKMVRLRTAMTELVRAGDVVVIGKGKGTRYSLGGSSGAPQKKPTSRPPVPDGTERPLGESCKPFWKDRAQPPN